jgi:hypothetical protein
MTRKDVIHDKRLPQNNYREHLIYSLSHHCETHQNKCPLLFSATPKVPPGVSKENLKTSNMVDH